MAASSGGISALRRILGALGADLPVPVLVVQHSASDDGGALCEVLAAGCALPVVEGEPRQPVIAGCVYLAPPGYHLLVESGPRLALSVDDKVCHVRPSADVLFASAADVWHSALIGVVLTGANHDGAAGLLAIRSRKGLCVVQDPADAEMSTMPRAALEMAGADHLLPLDQIGPLLDTLCREPKTDCRSA